ncbi:GDSL esterase/lipase [Senna tora]|uniref:GDSL esterase/lipase n=1 Tax=Senna tora TaxID=362788 RepID=A0A835C5J6_9FABA|nr:GDSL esterase/lipase [Senna tora]
MRHYVENSKLEYGMNFACGGTGILNTFSNGPNISTQIDSLQKLVQQNVFTKHDLNSSLALFNAGGNDYATYTRRNGTLRDVAAFTSSLVNQLSSDVKRIEKLGVSKIAVALLMPMGCLPELSVMTSYQTCISAPNIVSKNHNQMLVQSLAKLNHELGKSIITSLDLYASFLSTLDSMQKRRKEHVRMMNPLEPCVKIVDEEEEARKYIMCKKPELSFFWDNVHPSQNGWHEVYQHLKSSLQLIVQQN